MLAMAEATLKKTKGIIMVNIKFKKICPKGSSIVALVPNTIPIIPPNSIDKSNTMEVL